MYKPRYANEDDC